MHIWHLVVALSICTTPDHRDHDAFVEEMKKLGEVQSIGKTAEGRDILVATVGKGGPAILVVGNVHAPHLLGSYLTLEMAKKMAEDPVGSFYFIPRPSPDATERNFGSPTHEVITNGRPHDDDRDDRIDEDGPDDLNGDGLITMMRVKDPSGEWMPHPDDPRILIRSERAKDEQGVYRLYTEGIDNDGDERWNEDPPGGVDFNRNLTFQYPTFQPGAGPHAVSEPEVRAIVDFAFDHREIAAVFCFTPDGNLEHIWKAGNDDQKIKTGILSKDAPYLEHLSKAYAELHGMEKAPEIGQPAGSFLEWAYFHYGRWAFGTRGWWAPEMKEEEEEPPEDGEPEEPKEEEKRGEDDLRALRWFEENEYPAFVEWQKVDHPDFPGKEVEVGGFRPGCRLNPPLEVAEKLIEPNVKMLRVLAEKLPRLEIIRERVETLGNGLFRIRVRLVNRGYLPTESAMGAISEQLQRLQMEILLPEGVDVLTPPARRSIGPLEGNGGEREETWLVRFGTEIPESVTIRAWAPHVGEATLDVKLEGE
jgi:hypothetical protein